MPWTTVRPHDVVAVIMGGGAGTRLFPLTKDRAKPAVPLAGKYRLVDIPISNCLNSELRRIFLLTQFNSGSLHRHIQQSYQFDNFSPRLRRDPGRGADARTAPTGTRAPPTPCARTWSTWSRTATDSCSSSRATSSTGWTTAP